MFKFNNKDTRTTKELQVCTKRVDVFYALIDQPTRILVPGHCEGINERLGPKFEV